MKIAQLFTDEEKQAYFERVGYKVEMREYKREIKYTHGSYGLETCTGLFVRVGEKWVFLEPFFEKVMRLKLKQLLTDKKFLSVDFIMIHDLAKELARNEQI